MTCLLLGMLSLGTLSTSSAQVQEDFVVDEVMGRIATELGNRSRNYDKLLLAVESAVNDALREHSWTDSAGDLQPLERHPHLAFLSQLAEAVRERAKEKKNSPRVLELLSAYPWEPLLELSAGLQYGSDRPVPKNEAGFVVLGGAPAAMPGYPELYVNYCLYGMDEISGWRTGIKKGKNIYAGRSLKQRNAPVLEMPAWEALRVYLTGNLPDAALLAIPELTRRIHSRLAERRRGADGLMAPMDLFLTILDSKWDGFLIEVPFEKEPIPYVVPLHELLTNTSGFSYHFPGSAALQASGDLPFLSITALMQYSEVLRGEKLPGKEFIQQTLPALTARQEFDAGAVYLSRYKRLIDLIVRALVSPEIPFPEYLSVYDYPQGAPPTARQLDTSFDVPRRHVLLLWAALGEDPEALADWLFEEVFSKQENAYPRSVSLPVAFLTASREHEPEMLAAVAKRIEEARAGTGAATANSFLSADFEREFSPYSVLLSLDGTPEATALAHSFQYFHKPLSETIRQAAYGAILKKL